MGITITCFSLRVFMKTAGFCSLFNRDLDSQLDLTLCNATLTYWHFMHCLCVHEAPGDLRVEYVKRSD